MLSAISNVVDTEPMALKDRLLDGAERRHVRYEPVHVDWQLDWQDGHLEVRLTGRPEERPFQAYVVVEEAVYSGEDIDDDLQAVPDTGPLVEWIHTPFTVEVVNQLLDVPTAFFRRERKALDEADRKWRDFLRRYAEQRPVAPGEPIQSLLDRVRELRTQSSSTATLVGVLEERAAFAREQAPDLWEAATGEEA